VRGCPSMNGRSRISNEKSLFIGGEVDGRSKVAGWLRNVLAEITSGPERDRPSA